MAENNKTDISSISVFSNFIWRFLERVGAQGVTFVVSIVLARLLDPEVYGVVALVTVFTTIMQVFVDSGLGNALIQKKMHPILIFQLFFLQYCFMLGSLLNNVFCSTVYCCVLQQT